MMTDSQKISKAAFDRLVNERLAQEQMETGCYLGSERKAKRRIRQLLATELSGKLGFKDKPLH